MIPPSCYLYPLLISSHLPSLSTSRQPIIAPRYLTTAKMSRSAGNGQIDVERLRGQENYLRWARDFKVIADSRGLMQYYLGNKVMLEEPQRTRYFSSISDPRHETRQINDSTDVQISVANSVDKLARLSEYQLELARYENQCREEREALQILIDAVDPILRGDLQGIDKPDEAWKHLKEQYQMTSEQALFYTIERVKLLKHTNCRSMQDYLNQRKALEHDIDEIQGENSNQEEQVDRIIYGLPLQYSSSIHEYHKFRWNSVATGDDIRQVTSELLTYEPSLKQRDGYLKHQTSSGRGRVHDGNESDEKPRLICSYVPCGEWGHYEEICPNK